MNGKPMRMMTEAELWGLGRKPDTADVAFIRNHPKPDGRSQYMAGEKLTMSYGEAEPLRIQGVLVILKCHFDRGPG
jgi:hypothetical protein